MTTETLAHDVAWEPSGHLSEVALSVIADGEDALLDAAAQAHLAACETCARNLGQIALRAADVAGALSGAPAFVAEVKLSLPAAALEPQPIAPVIVQAVPNEAPDDRVIAPATARPISSRRKPPVIPLLLAMAIALLGALPSVMRLGRQLSQTWTVLRDVTPAIVRLAPQALAKAWSGPQGAKMAPFIWLVAAALVAAGLAIASRASKKMLMDGGRR